jgi:hypothetical protein
MRLGTNPLLECRRIFHSRDVDETRAWLRSKEFRFDLLDRQHVRPDVRVNGVYLPNMYLGYLQYGVQAVVRAAPTRKDYWIHLPIRGSLTAEFGSDNIVCNARRAAIMSPTRHNYNSMRLDARCARVHIYFHQDALLRQLTALLGEPMDQPVEFEPTLALTSGYGRSLASYLLAAVADLERPDAMLHNPIMMTMFEQFITTGLLLSHPHTCSERLRQREKPISPRSSVPSTTWNRIWTRRLHFQTSWKSPASPAALCSSTSRIGGAFRPCAICAMRASSGRETY